MSIKQYQTIRIGFVILLAIVFSQAIVWNNYFVPIIVLIASSLILLAIRKKVDGILADERDRLSAGKAALLAIQIYSWLAVIAMFVLYASRDINPAYEPIGMALAYSTCILMLIYSLIFRYHNRTELGNRKSIYVVLVIVFFLVLAVFSIRLFSGEDNWVCQDGQWIRHGQPDFPAPTVECK